MLNRVVLMGRLTRDPEVRRTQAGTPVASFALAVERDYAANGAEKQTDFIDIVAWQHTAEFVGKYFTKGRMAVVAGRLQVRDWTDRSGEKRRAYEVVADSIYFGDSKRDGQQQSSQYGQTPYSQNQYQARPQQQYGTPPPTTNNAPMYQAYTTPVSTSDFAELDDDDSDLPF